MGSNRTREQRTKHDERITRKIPATLATQHPDNASVPYWGKDAFINTLDEIDECYRMFSDLDCEEVMWDWEGKYSDEALIDKLFTSYFEFFQRKQLGRDVFLLVRIPNIWQEKGYRIARAFMSIVTAEDLADDLGLTAPPIFEVVLPMVDSADKLMYVHDAFKKVAEVEHEMFTSHPTHSRYVNVLPLTESSEELLRTRKLIMDYLGMHKEHYGEYPAYLRPFIARSDPALNAGLVPAVLGAKAAISELYRIADETKIPMYPVIGVGSLPFRGGLSPYTVEHFLKEYGGVRTVTVQSAFRYDYPLPDVKTAVRKLNEQIPQTQPQIFDENEINKLINAADTFQEGYKRTVESLAPAINEFAGYVPERRERLIHTGLFGYSRAVGSKHLPRAIRYTAVLYSLGVPPEFIGTGRGIENTRKAGLLESVERAYVNLKDDLANAGRFLNKENLAILASEDETWNDIAQDVELVENYLGRELGPVEDADKIHRNLTSNVLILYRSRQEFQPDLERAARLRRSLG